MSPWTTQAEALADFAAVQSDTAHTVQFGVGYRHIFLALRSGTLARVGTCGAPGQPLQHRHLWRTPMICTVPDDHHQLFQPRCTDQTGLCNLEDQIAHSAGGG